mgnify:FL=1
MKFIEVAQGSEYWLKLRSGKITASCVADAISMIGSLDERQQQYVDFVRGGALPKDAAVMAGFKAPPSAASVARVLAGGQAGVPSDTAHRYAADLAIEQISGQPHGEPPRAWVLERGHEMEERARMLYEARTRAFVTESGICISDCEGFAYSSDGLVNDDGLIEVKAPIDSLKIAAMWRTGDVSEYLHQMQTGMWLTGRAWCDFLMFVPDLAKCGKDLYVKRICRDDAFIDAMVLELARFQFMISDYRAIFVTHEPTKETITIGVTMSIIAETPAPEVADTRPVISVELEESTEPTPEPTAPPTLRLGMISERLGFTITADFLRGLGFEHSATDKAAKLYYDHEFKSICAALCRHISAVSAAN